MKLLRLRSNVGAFRIEIESFDITTNDLICAISDQFHVKAEHLKLSHDLEETKILSNEDVLTDIGVKMDGHVLYICGRFEKKNIAKSYVGENGKVIPAGLHLIYMEQQSFHQEGEKKEKEEKTADTREKVLQSAASSKASDEKLAESMTGLAVETSKPSNNFMGDGADAFDDDGGGGGAADSYDCSGDAAFAAALAAEMYEEQVKEVEDDKVEDSVRSPDKVQRMTLIGGGDSYSSSATTASNQLNDSDLEQLAAHEQMLTTAGLDEMTINHEISTLRDELLARKLHKTDQFEQISGRFGSGFGAFGASGRFGGGLGAMERRRMEDNRAAMNHTQDMIEKLMMYGPGGENSGKGKGNVAKKNPISFSNRAVKANIDLAAKEKLAHQEPMRGTSADELLIGGANYTNRSLSAGATRDNSSNSRKNPLKSAALSSLENRINNNNARNNSSSSSTNVEKYAESSTASSMPSITGHSGSSVGGCLSLSPTPYRRPMNRSEEMRLSTDALLRSIPLLKHSGRADGSVSVAGRAGTSYISDKMRNDSDCNSREVVVIDVDAECTESSMTAEGAPIPRDDGAPHGDDDVVFIRATHGGGKKNQRPKFSTLNKTASKLSSVPLKNIVSTDLGGHSSGDDDDDEDVRNAIAMSLLSISGEQMATTPSFHSSASAGDETSRGSGGASSSSSSSLSLSTTKTSRTTIAAAKRRDGRGSDWKEGGGATGNSNSRVTDYFGPSHKTQLHPVPAGSSRSSPKAAKEAEEVPAWLRRESNVASGRNAIGCATVSSAVTASSTNGDLTEDEMLAIAIQQSLSDK